MVKLVIWDAISPIMTSLLFFSVYTAIMGDIYSSDQLMKVGPAERPSTDECWISKANPILFYPGLITVFGWHQPWKPWQQFSAVNLALAGFPQTNALGENMPSRY